MGRSLTACRGPTEQSHAPKPLPGTAAHLAQPQAPVGSSCPRLALQGGGYPSVLPPAVRGSRGEFSGFLGGGQAVQASSGRVTA